jgi:hypothetical protein
MKNRKDKQMLIASILLDIGMEDDVIEAVTSLEAQEFLHLKK